jgi:Smg protein
MKEKVVEILIYIMSEIQGNKRLSEIDLGDLTRRGYTQSEISAAFTWLYDTMPLQDGVPVRPPDSLSGSVRILHDVEKAVLGIECHGYLIQLRELGLLDLTDFERVIERVMMSGEEKIDLEDLRMIIASVLLSKEGRGNGSGSPLLSGEPDRVH